MAKMREVNIGVKFRFRRTTKSANATYDLSEVIREFLTQRGYDVQEITIGEDTTYRDGYRC